MNTMDQAKVRAEALMDAAHRGLKGTVSRLRATQFGERLAQEDWQGHADSLQRHADASVDRVLTVLPAVTRPHVRGLQKRLHGLGRRVGDLARKLNEAIEA